MIARLGPLPQRQKQLSDTALFTAIYITPSGVGNKFDTRGTAPSRASLQDLPNPLLALAAGCQTWPRMLTPPVWLELMDS